jgi:hypothetical protein
MFQRLEHAVDDHHNSRAYRGIVHHRDIGMTIGPSRNMLPQRARGQSPHKFSETNKHDVPVAIMILQAVLVTGIALVFVFPAGYKHRFRYGAHNGGGAILHSLHHDTDIGRAIPQKQPRQQRQLQDTRRQDRRVDSYCSGADRHGIRTGDKPYTPRVHAGGHAALLYDIHDRREAVFIAIPLLIYKFRKPGWLNASEAKNK